MSARGALVSVLLGPALVCGVLSGCSEEHAVPPPTPTRAAPTEIPPYDAGLPPAQAVLALVPARSMTLRLVDLAVIRRQVGLPELTSRSSAEDRAAFRTRAAALAPQPDRPLLGGSVDRRLRTEFGFGADDVAWQAHFSGGHRRGWVLSFGPGVDMTAVRAAVHRGVGPLRGARVDTRDHLVTEHAAAADEPVWGSDPRWVRLVPAPGESFVVRRGCVPRASLPPRAGTRLLPELEPLAGFAVTFGDHVATVRVGRGRADLFDRVRVARSWPVPGGRFGEVFRNGVADPSSGRIGYDVPRPARAAALARRDLLPFGVCA